MFQILTRLAVKRPEPILVTAAHKREVISKAMKYRLSRTTNSTLNRYMNCTRSSLFVKYQELHSFDRRRLSSRNRTGVLLVMYFISLYSHFYIQVSKKYDLTKSLSKICFYTNTYPGLYLILPGQVSSPV